MLAAARRELANAGVSKPPDVVVADAGYWHLEQMNQITGDGIPVLIPPDSSRRANKPKRPGWDGGAYDFLRSVLSTDLGQVFNPPVEDGLALMADRHLEAGFSAQEVRMMAVENTRRLLGA